MVITFFTWFIAPFLASFAVSRFRRPAQAPPALWQIVGVVAVVAAVSVIAVTLDGGWDPAIAAGAAGIGILMGQWLGAALRRPSPD